MIIINKIFDIGLLTRFLTKGLEKYYQATSSTVFIHVKEELDILKDMIS